MKKMMILCVAFAALSMLADTKTVGGKEYVYLATADCTGSAPVYGTAKTGALFSAATWSDGLAAHGDTDYLVDLGPENWIRASCGSDSATFVGRSLTLGNAETGDEGWFALMGGRPMTVSNICAVAGGILFTGFAGNWFNLDGTNMTIRTTAAKPFLFALASNHQVNSMPKIRGTEASAFKIGVSPASDIKSLAQSSYLKTESSTTSPFPNAVSDYPGRIIIEGTNVLFKVGMNAGGEMRTLFGAEPSVPTPDAVTLRYGGEISWSAAHTPHILVPANRGIYVGDGGGVLNINKRDCGFSATISGPGDLRVSSLTFFNSTLACRRLVVVGNATVRFAENARLGANTELEVEENGIVTLPCAGLKPAKTVLRGGATVSAGVGNGKRLLNNAANVVLWRPGDGSVGVLELLPGSVFEGTAGSPVKLSFSTESADGVSFTPRLEGGKALVLKIPTSVATVTADQFAFVSTDGTGSNWSIEVENDGNGMQSVSIASGTSTYVVPADTPGNTPTSPYSSWETAANDPAAVIGTATAGTVIRISPGVYNTSDTITIPSGVTVMSDDGEGNLCRDRVVFDGGAGDTPGTYKDGHRVFTVSASASLAGVTIRNGYKSDTGGGVYLNASSSVLSDCLIANCYALMYSGEYFDGGKGGGIAAPVNVSPTVRRCRIVGCKAKIGAGAFVDSNNSVSQAEYPSRAGVVPSFIDCEFVNNEAIAKTSGQQGGGICANTYARLWVENCVFDGNRLTTQTSSDSSRMGVAIAGGKHSIVRNTVFENSGSGCRAVVNGNEIRFSNCVFRNNANGQNCLCDGSLAENCVFSNNTVDLIYSGKVTFRNCLFAYNQSAGLHFRSSWVENCTIVSNRCGVHVDGDYTPKFINTICAFNKAEALTNARGGANFYIIWTTPMSNVTVSNCCFKGTTGYWNANKNESVDPNLADVTGRSFDADPKFVDLEGGDFRLSRKSPCRDKAQLLGWMDATTVDLAGNPRVVTDGKTLDRYAEALPDMGCFENQEKMPGFVVIFR